MHADRSGLARRVNLDGDVAGRADRSFERSLQPASTADCSWAGVGALTWPARIMARIWSEAFDAQRHVDHMPEVDVPTPPCRKVLVVAVGRYRLQFLSHAQLAAAIAWFERPLGSTRRNASGGDHWKFQPWQSELPKGMVKQRNRARILARLRSAPWPW